MQKLYDFFPFIYTLLDNFKLYKLASFFRLKRVVWGQKTSVELSL